MARDASAALAGNAVPPGIEAYAALAEACGLADLVWACPGGVRPARFVAAGDTEAEGAGDGAAVAPADVDGIADGPPAGVVAVARVPPLGAGEVVALARPTSC